MMDKKPYINKAPVQLVMFVLSLGISACNTEFARVIPDAKPEDSIDVVFGQPKVLYIIADGVRGQSLRDGNFPAISNLLPQSIYSWESLADEETTPENGTNWASMLTGVQKDKHGIVGDDFSAANLERFPLIFERIQTALPNSDLRTYTASQSFFDHLTAGADERQLLSDDESVKTAAVAALGVDTITMVTAHFNGADAVGAQYGYDLSVPQYAEALEQFDAYVGDLLTALKDRPDYNQENWMIVITSSRGGAYDIPEEENDNTIFSNPSVNTFTIFHARRYITRIINKPFLGMRFQGDFVRFRGQLRGEVTAGDNDYYNPDSTAFTIELKVKKNPGPNNNYQYRFPALLSKRARWNWDDVGWTIFLEDNFWMFNARGLGGNVGQTRGGTLANATWNSIAVVGVLREDRRYIRTYTNGQFNNEVDITGYGSIENDLPLILGSRDENGQADCFIADVRFWKVALPDDVIAQYSCETSVPQDHPYYDFLAGLWPVVGSENNTILDEGPFGSHITLGGNDVEREAQADYVCAPGSSELSRTVPRNVDIPVQILTWLKIPRQENWELDGRVWLDR
ncbi:alkaline phosphatase family protein [Parapedobacter deserti]|uniref:Alkaline phosphatase family protein n=1 Tax=Parapedobacter deserti TaxID=1912957 RepID=A0ABV7JG45_9SPHI